MWLVNFGHPLTDEQRRSVEQLTGQRIDEVVEQKSQFDHAKPFSEQAAELIDRIPLTADQWQSVPLIVSPPTLASIACVVLAELHGRMGYFPPILRLRPIADRVPPQFEVAEIVDLQRVRQKARERR